MYEYHAIVRDVYDGDSITADVDLGFKVWIKGMKIRLAGIDAPEIRGEERPEGIISRDYLKDLILGKDVSIKTIMDKSEKYGRYLATIYLNGININRDMIEHGFAKEFKG